MSEQKGIDIDLWTAIERLKAYEAIGTPEEIKALVAENKRLHEENFWLTGHRGQEEEKPLTLEELLEMDGQPVYLVLDRKWYIVSVNYELPHGMKQPCGVDKFGAGTSLRLLSECGLYRHPTKENEDV